MEIDGEQTYTPHGLKRQPDDDLESEQRLAKRFNLLNLENASKLYISVRPSSGLRNRSNAFSDSMHLDSTRDRVFIHDLDQELADLSSDDEKLVFLPDIDKRLTKLPKSVLIGNNPPERKNEVVLYKVPESLSIPKEQDNVHKAMLESRERAREKQLQDHVQSSQPEVFSKTYHGPTTNGQLSSSSPAQKFYDADEMEIG